MRRGPISDVKKRRALAAARRIWDRLVGRIGVAAGEADGGVRFTRMRRGRIRRVAREICRRAQE